jgi:methylglutaconyl-CoA hydratase
VSGVDVTRDGAVATVTLARPERRNALDPALMGAIGEEFASLGADPTVRVVVLRGAGPAFCAGADLAWMEASGALSHEENVADARAMAEVFATVDACPKAVVVAVHGAALGGGIGLVACADVTIAVEGTAFGFSEVRLGLVPATISPYVLRSIGPGHARALFTSGRRFDAAEAFRLGLVHRVVADGDLDAAVDEAIAEFLAAGPEAIAACKRLVREASASLILPDLPERIAAARVGAEGQEGARAFLERRKPAWSDGS